jgi:hypothetical protein
MPYKDLEKRKVCLRKWRTEHPEARKPYDEQYRTRPEVKKRLKRWQGIHKEEHIKYARKWTRELKLYFMNILGGKCQRCGYNRCLAALDFHHINPEDKEVTEEWKRRKKTFEEKIKSGKIQLLCANCHRELHHKEE